MKALYDLQRLLEMVKEGTITREWRQQVQDNANALLKVLDNGETGEEWKVARSALVDVLNLGEGHSVSKTEKRAEIAVKAALGVFL